MLDQRAVLVFLIVCVCVRMQERDIQNLIKDRKFAQSETDVLL